MFTLRCLFSVVCLAEYFSWSVCVETIRFQYVADFDNRVCDGADLVFSVNLPWKLQCTRQCARNILCNSVFVNGNGQCTGCKGTYSTEVVSPNSLSSSTGTSLYNLDQTVPEVEVTTPDCSGHPDGAYLPDLTNCSRYFHCSAGNPVSIACGTGTVFDTTISNCNFLASVPSCPCENCAPT